MINGDKIVIRILSYKNAKNNPNEPYLIYTSVDLIKKLIKKIKLFCNIIYEKKLFKKKIL